MTKKQLLVYMSVGFRPDHLQDVEKYINEVTKGNLLFNYSVSHRMKPVPSVVITFRIDKADETLDIFDFDGKLALSGRTRDIGKMVCEHAIHKTFSRASRLFTPYLSNTLKMRIR